MKRVLKHLDILDRISFKQIFGFWVAYMFIFGIIFYVLSLTTDHAVLYKGAPLAHGINGFFTAQYFSFITAASASQGYGDIFPVGVARFFAVIEAVSGLVIFGVIISKLLSEKQETLLQEVYEISFEEKVNRIRSAFYLFRADVSKIIEKIEHKTISQRSIADLWITFTTLESAMHDVTRLIQPQRDHKYVKQIDDLSIELVLNSISQSLTKANDLLATLDDNSHSWRNETINSIIDAVSISIENISGALRKKEPNKKIIDKLNEVLLHSKQLKDRTHLMVSVSSA